MPNKKGGYKIVSLKGLDLLTEELVIVGLFLALQNSYGKVILLDDIVIDGEEKKSAYVHAEKVGDNYVVKNLYGYDLTISDEDEVTAVEHQEGGTELPTPTLADDGKVLAVENEEYVLKELSRYKLIVDNIAEIPSAEVDELKVGDLIKVNFDLVYIVTEKTDTQCLLMSTGDNQNGINIATYVNALDNWFNSHIEVIENRFSYQYAIFLPSQLASDGKTYNITLSIINRFSVSTLEELFAIIGSSNGSTEYVATGTIKDTTSGEVLGIYSINAYDTSGNPFSLKVEGVSLSFSNPDYSSLIFKNIQF